MSLAETWAPQSAADKYGVSFGGPTHNATTELTAISTPSALGAAQTKILSLDNPFVAFAALAAVTAGLMAFSTSVRVGGTKASLSLGDTK